MHIITTRPLNMSLRVSSRCIRTLIVISHKSSLVYLPSNKLTTRRSQFIMDLFIPFFLAKKIVLAERGFDVRVTTRHKF